MVNERIVANARADVGRLDSQLRELRLEEERCQFRRARLEAERVRVQALIDLYELTQRFDVPVPDPNRPKPVVLTKPDGTKFVDIAASRAALAAYEADQEAQSVSAAAAEVRSGKVRSRTPPSRQKRKPAGLPTVAEMVLAILEGEGAGMRPRDIARIARRKWWPDLRAAAVNAAVWKLAGSGRLEKDGHLYKLNGHADEG
jgi:hypothetical protein